MSARRALRATSLRGVPRRVVFYALALAALALVFLSYLSPDMMFTLATQVWSCF